jgi:hypothetical protein
MKRILWALWIFTVFMITPPVMVWFYWLCVYLESISLNPLFWDSGARACLFWWGVIVFSVLAGVVIEGSTADAGKGGA